MLSFMVYSFFVVVVYFLMDKGFVSKETVVLRGWGSRNECFVLSTELIK